MKVLNLRCGQHHAYEGWFASEEDFVAQSAAARSGALTDAKTLIGLLWLQNWRAGRWPLEWHGAPARS